MIVALLTVNCGSEKPWRVEAVDSTSIRAHSADRTVVLGKPEALDLVRAIIDCFTQKESKHE